MTSPTVGLATKTGLTATVTQFAAAIALVATGDHSTEAVTALVGAVVTLVTVLAGRYAQATAAARKA